MFVLVYTYKCIFKSYPLQGEKHPFSFR